LPLGLQLTARPGDDARLLDVAAAIESMLADRNR
jgi:Asp-tRNA(Asn)/Glu-tRNA(Gln) amidotransferase A subunit family amidase